LHSPPKLQKSKIKNQKSNFKIHHSKLKNQKKSPPQATFPLSFAHTLITTITKQKIET